MSQTAPESVATLMQNGKAVPCIESGSTRIKAVLTDIGHLPSATGSHRWNNSLVDGFWN